MTRQAAIYCRISSDPTGLAAGVERQEADCRAFCEAAGWEIAEVYVDNDISAYTGKPRPAYLRMMSAIESGTVNALVAWHLDRLHRRPRELEDFIETCERARLTDIKTLHGDVDLTTSQGRLVARLMGSVARHSSEHSSERIRRKLRRLGRKGPSAQWRHSQLRLRGRRPDDQGVGSGCNPGRRRAGYRRRES